MSLSQPDRLAAFSILFPEPQARVLAKLTWPEIESGSAGTKGQGAFARWTLLERERLRAFCALVDDFGTPPPPPPAPPSTPAAPKCTHPIALSFHPRVAGLFDRSVFILCLDAKRDVDEEVLAVMGGALETPPPLKTLLRHMLIRPHTAFTIVDFRPYTTALVDPATVTAFDRLRDLASIAGVRLNDWFVLGYENIDSARDHLVAPDATVADVAQAA